MGHRANFIVIRHGAGQAYHDQWAALGCLFAFASGPEEAMLALKEMGRTDELLDWAFAEGGYLLDFDTSTAVAFGNLELPDGMEEELPENVTAVVAAFERGAGEFLKQIAPNWRGWRLRFDDRGVDAFSEYLRQRNITSIECQPDSHPTGRTFAEICAWF